MHSEVLYHVASLCIVGNHFKLGFIGQITLLCPRQCHLDFEVKYSKNIQKLFEKIFHYSLITIRYFYSIFEAYYSKKNFEYPPTPNGPQMTYIGFPHGLGPSKHPKLVFYTPHLGTSCRHASRSVSRRAQPYSNPSISQNLEYYCKNRQLTKIWIYNTAL